VGAATLVGSSPERLVRLEEGRVEMRPLAGTRPRGRDAAADRAHADALLADPKERAEHVMLVDLTRNDVGRISRYGTVRVTELMAVERYSHVMHLVSHVTGELAPGRTAWDVLQAVFPHGTVSGAPKVRAMEIIDELEPLARGPYAGSVGYIGFDGTLNTAITIRTVLVKDGTAYVQAGAGIVADSVPEREHEECVAKARGMLAAIARATAGGGR
jgi:anthranilate synthase component 1